MQAIEFIAALFGLVAVTLTVYRSVWCWPTGLVQVALYAKVFYDARLYSQAWLQIVFAVLQLHGWWQWRRSLLEPGHGTAREQVPVTSLTAFALTGWLVLCLALSLVVGWGMATYTAAAWPMADAFIAGTSLVAQWLLIHRKLENWYLWIVVNVMTIIVCAAQSLWPTVALYVLFLGLAVGGLVTWQRALATESASELGSDGAEVQGQSICRQD